VKFDLRIQDNHKQVRIYLSWAVVHELDLHEEVSSLSNVAFTFTAVYEGVVTSLNVPGKQTVL